MTHPNRVRLSKLSLGLMVALAAAPVFAQSTSAGVGGQVVGADGQPIAGAEVTITHVDSGTVSRATTDAAGRYTSRGLRVGGPYTITVNKAGVGTDTEENVYLELNKVSTVDANLASGGATTLGTVTVVGSGSTSVFSSDNKGVGTSVSGRQLELAPQSSRSLDDVARLDPRISVTDQATGRISMAGLNNRYNNITVDGLGQNDPFGLNSNGMPYTGSPISTDTIDAYDIKATDYDVAQDTIGASINAVTKSGTNEFHGSVYYAFKNASNMVGKHPTTDADYNLFDKDETKGLTLGGPIIKDKLFFFGSYEKQDVTEFGGATADDAFARGIITQADIDRVIAAAKGYGIDPGTYGGASGVNLSLKRYLGKIDWNINDSHRASLTYQQTEESLPQPYDGGAATVILTSRWYQKNSTTKNTSLQLFSDWTDNFSTEAKFSVQKFDQIAGNPFNEGPTINISAGVGNSATSGQGIRLGEDRNRHENQINTKKYTASIFGTYYLGDHAFKFGFDWLKTDALNLYGRDLHGVYTFGSIADFEAGKYNSYTVRRPAAGFTEADTAAAVGMSQFSPFIQDTWQATDNLSLVYGVRVNIPKGDSEAPVKPGFEQVFGYPNNYKLGSDNKVVMPRFAFNYTFNTERYSQLRGGIGLFQTVPPYVWLANPFQNNGVNAVSFNSNNPVAYPFSPDPYNQPVPPNLSTTGRAQVDSIDPNFKMPTAWKLSLGYDVELPWAGLIGTAEIQHVRHKDAVFYKAINIGAYNPTTGLYDAPTARLLDGRNSYWCTLGSLSSSNKNCGNNPGYTSSAANGSGGSTMLSNIDAGRSTSFTVSLNKPLSNGWYGNVSYTFTDATEVGSDTSSQAWSSYQFVSRLNPNDRDAKTATQEIRNVFKATLGWEHAFFGDYKTSVSAYYSGHNGLPYTWIMNGDQNGDGIFQDPAYIPLINDPKVSYGTATAAQIAAFNDFIDSDSYLSQHRGSIAERNDSRLPWVNQLDVGIQQELPGFFKSHKAVVRLDFYNFLNLLNKDWGITKSVGGFDTRYLASLGGIRPDGGYVYNLGSATTPTWQQLSNYDANSAFPSRVVSRWSVLMTVKYEF
ncbi:TonB-dependent receptor [Thermomonas sp. HDW16]|uniref:TonB-dependent receptor n=1 Tax=Thermomonas sp. HDW16 TaxID=2714945 RepID=UPI0014094122|nr:TonB-dependent receptor [Thermomonas sp. HDW16]QIL20164.1 Oar protein [Thermomonas sp. HDW16]